MELISNIFLWIFHLNAEGLVLLFIGIISFIFASMCLLAFSRNETLLEHFDNNIKQYITILLITIIFFTLTLTYQISLSIFIGLIFCILPMLRIIAYRNKYSNYSNGTQNRNKYTGFFAKLYDNRDMRIKRRKALRKAASFLKPYENILGKLILSNKYCQLTYQPNAQQVVKFICISKQKNNAGTYSFLETYSEHNLNWNNDFFNSICSNYTYNTTFENLYSLFEKSDFIIENSNYTPPAAEKKPQSNNKLRDKQQEINKKIKKIQQQEELEKLPKININDATEAELTALPGISIVQAKKIVKYRNINGDFKSVDDFISFLSIKPHFIDKIKIRIKATPTVVNINVKQCVSNERIIDFD